MPGRKYSTATYRYGFNGKENDGEAAAAGDGLQDYGLRIYNPSLGKFLSVDPLCKSFPYKSVYDFAENSPISGVDLEGGQHEFFLLAKAGLFGATAQKIATDIDKGAAKSVMKFAMGAWQTSKIVNGQASFQEYVNFGTNLTAQVLYTNAPQSKQAVNYYAAKTQSKTIKVIGQKMNALKKQDEDVVKAFKEGNTEVISEQITDVGILALTFLITEGLAQGATVGAISEEGAALNSMGAARIGFSKIIARMEKIIGTGPAQAADIVSGCEKIAKDLQKVTGGEFLEITPQEGFSWIGNVEYKGGTAPAWQHHVAVIKDGIVYDKMTGSAGMPYSEYINMFKDEPVFNITETINVK